MSEAALARTTQVRLDTTDEQAGLLHSTKDTFLECANRTSDWAWRDDDYCVTSKKKADDALYDDLREDTGLHANLVQKAIKRAMEAVDSSVEKLKEGEKTSQPEFTSWSVVYDKRSATFHDDHVSLATVDGRVEVPYDLPDDKADTPHGEYLHDPEYDVKRAVLQHRPGDGFYLHVNLKRDLDEAVAPPEQAGLAENPTRVLGVDLNATGAFAVTSTGKFIGSVDELNHERNEYEKRRAAMQRTGTRSAHLIIGRIGSRFAEWSEQWLHERANELLDEAERADVDGLVLEDLAGIRDRIADEKVFQQWAYRRFLEILRYKAPERGLWVDTVDPAYTSQTCSRCGHCEEANRSGDEFSCVACGYETHSDYNAAKCIARKYLANLDLPAGQTSQEGGASRQYALKSGMMIVNSTLESDTYVSAERESTDKPTTSVVGS